MKDFSALVWSRFAALSALLNGILFSPAGGACAEPASGSGDVVAVGRNPVLLIHGIHDSGASMQVMRLWLTAKGWQVYTMTLVPSNGRLPLEELAQQVCDYIRDTFPQEQQIDLVGFSMGGLVCRYYVQRLGGARRIGRFVAISAPNHGSRLAYLSKKPGCVQMRPGSTFLNDLNGDLTALREVQFVSMWTPLDLAIVPARSSRMSVGRDVTKWVIAHPLMVLQPECLRGVERILAEPIGLAEP